MILDELWWCYDNDTLLLAAGLVSCGYNIQLSSLRPRCEEQNTEGDACLQPFVGGGGGQHDDVFLIGQRHGGNQTLELGGSDNRLARSESSEDGHFAMHAHFSQPPPPPEYLGVLYVATAGQNGQNLGVDEEEVVLLSLAIVQREGRQVLH